MRKLIVTSLLLVVGLTGCSLEVNKPEDGKLDINVYNEDGDKCEGFSVSTSGLECR